MKLIYEVVLHFCKQLIQLIIQSSQLAEFVYNKHFSMLITFFSSFEFIIANHNFYFD